MKRLIYFMLFVSGSLFAQTDLIYPWVTNNNSFTSQVIINNLSGQPVAVTLTATRSDGTNEQSNRNIPAYDQLVSSSGDLFPGLGQGPGYAVRVTSEGSDIKGALVVAGTASASGSSPAQADVLNSAAASPIILYNFLPLSSGFSAPVVVNMGDTTARVIFYAFQGGELAGTSDPIDIEPAHPFAALVSDLFPDIEGNIYLVAEGDQSLTGMAFIFNDLREPSMSAATPISAVPDAPPAPAGGLTGRIDIDAIKGMGFTNQKIRENLDGFDMLGQELGLYAWVGFVVTWELVGTQIPAFVDGNLANGEAFNAILNFDLTEEVITQGANAGQPSGTGAMVGGAIEVLLDDGSGTVSTFYLNVPTMEGMLMLYDWFELP